MSARAFACVLLVACGAPFARGQESGILRVEAGAARVRQRNRSARDAVAMGALWRQGDRRLASLLSAAFTYAGDSATAAQGIAALAWRPTAESPWHTEAGLTGSAFGVYELGRGGNLSAYTRERVVFDDGSLWVGGFAGHTLRDGRSWHSTDVEFGGSVRSGGLEAGLAFARQRTNDWPLMQASGIFLQAEAAAHDIADWTVAAHYERGPLTLDAAHTWRNGLRQTLATQTAFTWSAEYELSPRFSLAVAAGRQLADPVRGTPDAQVASAALRMVLVPWRIAPVSSGAITARLTTGAAGGVLVVRVSAPGSARVEAAGTFSAWEPVALRRAGDAWEVQIPLRPGTHRVAVRIDGGPWRAPANLGKVRDEFGGESGIVVVP